MLPYFQRSVREDDEDMAPSHMRVIKTSETKAVQACINKRD